MCSLTAAVDSGGTQLGDQQSQPNLLSLDKIRLVRASKLSQHVLGAASVILTTEYLHSDPFEISAWHPTLSVMLPCLWSWTDRLTSEITCYSIDNLNMTSAIRI